MKTNSEKKAENFIRDLLLYPIAIIYFPFATIRILLWKWHFWVENNQNVIKEYQNKLNELG